MELYKKINLKYNKKEMGGYIDPLDYFREQIHDLENKYEALATEYKKVVTTNAFMKSLLEKRGLKYKFLKEQAKTLEEI